MVTAHKKLCHSHQEQSPMNNNNTHVIKQGKTVRFSNTPEEELQVKIIQMIEPISELSQSEREILWWQRNDYNEFKYNAFLVGKELCSGINLITYLMGALKACSTFNELNMTGKTLMRKLVRMAKHNHSLRGLERYTSLGYRQVTQDIRRDLVRAVLSEQMKQRKHRRDSLDLVDSTPKKNERIWGAYDDKMREIAEKFSRPSREFAQIMGVVDAVALGREKRPSVIV